MCKSKPRYTNTVLPPLTMHSLRLVFKFPNYSDHNSKVLMILCIIKINTLMFEQFIYLKTPFKLTWQRIGKYSRRAVLLWTGKYTRYGRGHRPARGTSGNARCVGRVDALLLLTPVAEPHAHHLGKKNGNKINWKMSSIIPSKALFCLVNFIHVINALFLSF